jgi:peroxiredoxin
MFIIEKGLIKFNISDSIYNSNIDNSTLNHELQKFEKNLSDVMQKYNNYKSNGIDITTIEDFKIMDSLSKVYSKIWNERKIAYADYIRENPNSEISLFALKYEYGGINMDVLRQYETLNDIVKKSDFGKSLKNQMVNYSKRINKRLSINDVVPNFKLKNSKQLEIAIYNVKSKYILLDFWASWCGPCRKENKSIRKFYDDLNESDFKVIGVSVDDSESKWKKALKEDNINWISLWDENKKINDQFGIVSYPTNYLLNDKFEIIDSNINAEKLKEKLNKLLK